MRPNAMIALNDLTVAYARHPALHHVSGTFATASMTAVVGPNGAGKSTLLKAIVGSLRASQGELSLNGISRADIAYLPQQAEIDRTFPVSVLDTVLMGNWRRHGGFRAIGRAPRIRALQALAAVGLEGFEGRYISTLSAGQFQRVLFSRMMLQDARLLLLDEPFTAIDEGTTIALLKLIRDWNQASRTIIAVLHDLEQVRQWFPDTLLLARDLVAWGPTAHALTDENVLRSRAMSEAWDERAPQCERSVKDW